MARRFGAIVAAAVFAAAGLAYGQEPASAEKPATKQAEKKKDVTLKVGDRAPELHIAKWVRGEPVTGFEKGKTYVVEFWATWCGPCVKSMPHLTALQKEYKDQVTIIGVTTEDPNNSLEQVKDMVEQKGTAGMGYTVGWDDGTQTKDAFFKAAGLRGIPAAFVVDGKGTVQYIGHPMWLDTVLERVVKGDWDPKKGAEEIKKGEQELDKYAQADDAKEKLARLSEFEKDYPAAAGMFAGEKYLLMVKTNDPKAPEYGRKLIDEAIRTKDAAALNEYAWGIVDPKADLEHRDLDLAMLAASKGVEFTHEKDGMVLDTLARVYFDKGDVAKAIELEEKAVKLVPEQFKDELEASLKEFKDAKK
jgi:thiol-disulfide isomerase/thioredoxin